jgi:hypothetical protein
MFSSSIHNLPSIETWEAAHNTFNNTPRPKGPRSNSVWDDNQRPLKDNRSYHYRIEQHNGGEYYDVCLHHTVMARYYKPTPEGRRVLYTGHPSNMSKQFMRHVLNVHHKNTWTTTDGRLVAVPIANRDNITDKGSTFSADLWLVSETGIHAQRLIDVAKSSHTTHYIKRMSPDDKAAHKRARANMENLITLACMRIPEFFGRVYLDYDLLEPFRGADVDYAARNALEVLASGQFAALKPESQEVRINEFMMLAENVYDYEAVKVAARYPTEATAHIAEHVTEKTLADALWRIAKRECSTLKRRSDFIQLAPFMDAKEFPNTATPYP